MLDSEGMGYWESAALKTRIARHYRETYGVRVDFDPQDGRHFMRFSFAVSTSEVIEALHRLEPRFARVKASG